MEDTRMNTGPQEVRNKEIGPDANTGNSTYCYDTLYSLCFEVLSTIAVYHVSILYVLLCSALA